MTASLTENSVLRNTHRPSFLSCTTSRPYLVRGGGEGGRRGAVE